MKRITLAVAVLLSACDVPKAPPAHTVDADMRAEPIADPPAVDFEGTFEIASVGDAEREGYRRALLIQGDADGAVVITNERCAHCKGPPPDELTHGRLSPAQVQTFLDELKKRRFWVMLNGPRAMPVDPYETRVRLRVGKVTRQLQTNCIGCVQQELVNLIEHQREIATPAVMPPAALLTFTRPTPSHQHKAIGSCKGFSCELVFKFDPQASPGHRRWGWFRSPWCQPVRDELWSCFFDPFDPTELLVDTRGLPPPEVGEHPAFPRAVVLRSGEQCSVDQRYGDWQCDRGTQLKRLAEALQTWVAFDENGNILPLSGIYLR